MGHVQLRGVSISGRHGAGTHEVRARDLGVVAARGAALEGMLMYTLRHLSAGLLGLLLACSAGVALAQSGDLDNPPARVARLSHLDGPVSFTPAGESEWVEAELNRPIVTGDALWTDARGLAELQIGSTVVELDHATSFDFLALDDDLAQMELTQGTLNLSVPRLYGEETYEVDTPNIAFVADRVGDYRIAVDAQGVTVVSVRDGGGDVFGEGGVRMSVAAGQSVRFLDSRLQDYEVDSLGPTDPFDRYVADRARRFDHPRSRTYVSSYATGYEDLDEYGSWDESPEYGHIWYPRGIAADWAPYHDGHWAWIDPWGWTWIDDAPWGFTPFHYGRWAYVDSRWGWVPGPLDVEPIYAPALVAFVGGSGFGVDISIGGPIGWFALGPRDVYFPGYRCGRDYFNRVNLGNAYVTRTVVNNYYGDFARGGVDFSRVRYANRDAPRALAVMSGSGFVAGRRVASSSLRVDRATFANARILPRATLVPTRQSLAAGRRRASAPPTRALHRNIVAAHQPPAARPSFAQRQQLLQRNRGEPLTTRQLGTLAARRGHGRDTTATANVRVVDTRGTRRISAAAGAHGRGSHERSRETAQGGSARNNPRQVRSATFAHEGRSPHARATPPATAQRQARANDRRDRDAVRSARGRALHDRAQAQVRSSEFAHRETATRAGERNRPASRARAQAAAHQRATRQADARARQHASRQAHTREQQSASHRTGAEQRASRQAQARTQQRASHYASARAQQRASRQASARVQQQHASRQAEARTQQRAAAHAQARVQQQASRRVEARASAQRASRQAQQRPAPPQRQIARSPAQQRQPAQARRTASAHEPRGRRNAKDKNDDDKGHPRGG
jgi:hypothetical protein